MDLVDQQLGRLKARFPDASCAERGNLGQLITLPTFSLPNGWNKAATTVQFLVPTGYPFAKPDSFWADGDLRVAVRGNAMPQSTQFNNAGLPEMSSKLWFSWHLQAWDPNRDDLQSWVASIRDRLSRLS